MIICWIPNWVIGTCRARAWDGSAGPAGAWAAMAGLLPCRGIARLGGQHWSSWLLPFTIPSAISEVGRPGWLTRR